MIKLSKIWYKFLRRYRTRSLANCHLTSSFKFKRELQTAMSDSCALNSLFATWRRTCGHMAFSFMPYDMYQTSLRIRFKFQGDPCSIKEVMTEKQRRPPFKICPFYVIYTNGNWINSCTYVFCIQKPFPLVHYTINKQRRCHFCFLWSYLVIYKKFFFKIWRKWLLKFHEIFGLILFCWPYFSFLNAYSCVFRQNNASKFYFTFLSYHIFAYFFKIQGIKRWHILLNNWQILISETSVKSLNYLDSVGIKKKTGVSQSYFIPRESL